MKMNITANTIKSGSKNLSQSCTSFGWDSYLIDSDDNVIEIYTNNASSVGRAHKGAIKYFQNNSNSKIYTRKSGGDCSSYDERTTRI